MDSTKGLTGAVRDLSVNSLEDFEALPRPVIAGIGSLINMRGRGEDFIAPLIDVGALYVKVLSGGIPDAAPLEDDRRVLPIADELK